MTLSLAAPPMLRNRAGFGGRDGAKPGALAGGSFDRPSGGFEVGANDSYEPAGGSKGNGVGSAAAPLGLKKRFI